MACCARASPLSVRCRYGAGLGKAARSTRRDVPAASAAEPRSEFCKVRHGPYISLRLDIALGEVPSPSGVVAMMEFVVSSYVAG